MAKPTPNETPISSTFDLPVFVASPIPKQCHACTRGPKFYEGCSLVECPQRARHAYSQWGEKQ